MSSSLHPIQLLARTDACTATVLHCVFLVDFDSESSRSATISRRLPYNRPSIGIIESGLALYIDNLVSKCNETERFEDFVITSSDGSRFYAFCKSYRSQLFIIVSELHILSFARELFDVLCLEKASDIPDILYGLCFTPIIPAPLLTYNIELSSRALSIQFSETEHPVDFISDNTIISIFHPIMLVSAWQALILERKVLVVTSTPSLLGSCCQFLRKIMLPLMTINMFVPHLPIQLIQAIEAPFPYLIGGDIADIRSSNVDLSESVIIDLDARVVIPPSKHLVYPEIKLPDCWAKKLYGDLHDIFVNPKGSWNTSSSTTPQFSPGTKEYICHQVNEVLQVFIRVNLSLFCARSCFVSAFFRKDHNNFGSTINQLKLSNRKLFDEGSASYTDDYRKKPSLGYCRRYKLSFGFMQLFHDTNRIEKNDVTHFTPCWVEMDNIVFAVYEFADDIPLFYINLKDFEAVVPSGIEPEGHVFEICTKQHAVYYFATTDTNTRRQWVDIIEENMKEYKIVVDTNIKTPSVKFDRAMSVRSPETLREVLDNTDDLDFPDDNDVKPINSSLLCFGIAPQSEEEDDKCTIMLRNHFMNTQMVSYLRSHLECSSHFDLIFRILEGTVVLDMAKQESMLKELIGDDGNVIGVLHRIKKLSEEEFFTNALISENHLHEVAKALENVDMSKSNTHDTIPDFNNGSADTSPSSQKNISPFSFSSFLKFRRFSKRDPKTDSPAASEERKREREITDYLRHFKEHISEMLKARRLCDADLRRSMVEERMKVVSNILLGITNQDVEACNKIIYIPVINIIRSAKDNQKNDVSGDVLSSSSMNSSAWFEYIWDSMIIPVPKSAEAVKDQSAKNFEESEQAFQKSYKQQLIAFLENKLTNLRSLDSTQHLWPIYQAQIGYLHQSVGNIDLAIECYAEGSIVDHGQLMECLALKFKQLLFSPMQIKQETTFQRLFEFLKSSSNLSDVVGLMSYRLIIELLHRDALSHQSAVSASAHMRDISDTSFRRVNSTTSEALEFNTVERKGNTSEVLNERYVCMSSDPLITPCELSINLLMRLRDLVKDYCSTPIYKEQVKFIGIPGNMCLECNLLPGMLDGLQFLSAFKSFEVQAAQFQTLDVLSLNTNEKIVFFCNVFNIMTVHGLIVKGLPGHRYIERKYFMNSCKYNIGGMIFSLLDIEQGILRNASSNPMIAGPITASNKFSDRDPRKALSLSEPKPLISFFLFLACVSSPALSVLRDPSKVDEELKQHATLFLSHHVKLGKSASGKVILLPQIVSMYWEDFGKKRRRVLKYIYKLLPPTSEIAEEIKNKIRSDSTGSSSDIEFITLNWTPALIL